MQPAPIPENEKERLLSLYKLGLLNTKPEERFDRITKTATRIFKVPISTLTLVDAKREWFKSCQGLTKREGNRAISFCGHALIANKILVISDTKKDKRFSGNPMVTGKPYIRFYAGVPITNADGQRVGVFCVKDTKQRKFSKREEEILTGLAAWAELEVNSRNLSLALAEQKKIREKLGTQMQGFKNANSAIQNVLEDLNIEKLKAETAEAKEKAILMSVGDGVLATDEKGILILINKVAEKLLGVKSKETLGKLLSEIVSLEDEKGNLLLEATSPITKALAGTTASTTGQTYYYTRNDKIKFPVAIMTTPINLNGKVIGAIEVFRDITVEKKIDKAKTEFVSLASHQLRTPLSTINWYVEMLLAGDVGKFNKKQKKYLNEIYTGNRRMVELVNSLLNVSRLELGTFIADPVSTDIVDIFKTAIKEIRPMVEKKEIALNEQYTANFPKVYADPKLIRIMFQNLISNAMKYTPEKGKITIKLSLSDDKGNESNVKCQRSDILIKVSDTGYGIPQGQQKQIFTKLFRADNVREKDVEGTGLGLYIVKSIVEHSGGKVWFESEENKGATFSVLLPLEGMKTAGK